MIDGTLRPWRVRAVNLAEHAGNPIHTDTGARAAGFPAALVAGVTTYAYLTHSVVAAWGVEWVRSGAAEVRYLAPVLDGELVECVPVRGDDGAPLVEARVGEEVRACCRVWPPGDTPPWRARDRSGSSETLGPDAVVLAGSREGYGRRIGDDLDVYDDLGVVHPAVWPALANDLVHDQLVEGSWIHTRSRVWHHQLVPVGATVVVSGSVVERFSTRSGERAVVEVTILLDGRPAAHLDHEAIIRLAPIPD